MSEQARGFSPRGIPDDQYFRLLQRFVKSLVKKWSEDEQRWRQLHDQAELYRDEVIRQAYALGIPPKELVEASAMPERTLFAVLDTKHHPELKRRHAALRAQDTTQLPRWADDFGHTLESFGEEEE